MCLKLTINCEEGLEGVGGGLCTVLGIKDCVVVVVVMVV